MTWPFYLAEVSAQTSIATQMTVNLTERERATILAALRRWLSYPAARGADSIATGGGKHKPLDNGEIERLYKRITKKERDRDSVRVLPAGGNGAGVHANGAIRGLRRRYGLK